MWNPTPSSSTASSSDNRQNIREVVGVDDCKCSDANQQLFKNCNKHLTSTFVDQLTGSTNIQQQQYHKEDFGQKIEEETIDSGLISEPQTPNSSYLDTDNQISADIKKLNLPESSKPQQNKVEQLDLDSGVIEEEYDEDDCELEGPQTNQSNEPKMILPHSVESGLPEWFCKLNLHSSPNDNATASSSATVAGSSLNNLGAPTQKKETNTPASCADISSAQQNQEQITPANAWEKYYQQNDDGDTTLHLACINCYEDVVAALIRMAPHPCLFNIQNDVAQTALHLAALTAQPKIIRMLLIAGAKPTVRDLHGNTALHIACIYGEEQCVRALTIPISASEVNEAHRQYGHRVNDNSYIKYAKLPFDLDIRNYDGENCVHLAAQAGHVNILRTLVLHGADINAREGKAGRTALHIAVGSCNEELTNYLLEECEKLNLETTTYAGLTAYQVACMHNKSEMQNILEKRGAEPLTPPDTDYDSSDSETDFEESTKFYDRFGDPGYFVGYNGGNTMKVA